MLEFKVPPDVLVVPPVGWEPQNKFIVVPVPPSLKIGLLPVMARKYLLNATREHDAAHDIVLLPVLGPIDVPAVAPVWHTNVPESS
jgi:hypothetical protein